MLSPVIKNDVKIYLDNPDGKKEAGEEDSDEEEEEEEEHDKPQAAASPCQEDVAHCHRFGLESERTGGLFLLQPHSVG